ncbi:MAG TPA: hypothetical protein VIY52_28740 [Streptosporangiaceae bacterium]
MRLLLHNALRVDEACAADVADLGEDGGHRVLRVVRKGARKAKIPLTPATVLLDWLTARGLTLATARQPDLDAWLSSQHATYRADAGNFIRWARKHKLTRLDAAAARWSGPSGVIDTETRWKQARWLLHDSTLKPEDRVAGLTGSPSPLLTPIPA